VKNLTNIFSIHSKSEEEKGGGEKLDEEAEVGIYICLSRFGREAGTHGRSGRSVRSRFRQNLQTI
jgi:hypothetical protein